MVFSNLNERTKSMKTKCKRNQFFMYKSKLVAVCFRRGDDFGDFKCISYSQKIPCSNQWERLKTYDVLLQFCVFCILMDWSEGYEKDHPDVGTSKCSLERTRMWSLGEQQAIKEGVLLLQTPNLSLLRQNRNLMMVHKVRAHESQSLASECDTVHSHRVQPRAPVHRPAANRLFLHNLLHV